ncbi:asparagine synthetase domain-containing protein CG17486-like [Drosophila kikkawai]|uniref:Asparagine synthetase domain-containing protein CG17486-like n=1 Tax=Drosophila kikkawai TaxID=30033 RepID=A0ABM3C8F3_DROKI|nr:asparagine synthetase domain-containing protein CG17486-like [Drosophila kikkawai]
MRKGATVRRKLARLFVVVSRCELPLFTFRLSFFCGVLRLNRLHLWQPMNEYAEQLLYNLDVVVGLKTTVESIISPSWLLKKNLEFDYDFYKFPYNADHVELYQNLINQPQIKASLNTLDKLLSNSVANRVKCTAPLCRICLSELNQKETVCRHAKICILFSGGIDCTILALLANKFVPYNEPIELINVAFESLSGQNVSEKLWDVPDRRTSLMSVNELKRICPERFWNLLEVNVTREELKTQLSTRIKNLIYPLQTILDESLGCAYWFASNCPNSTARVALIGSGADELFGGYCRHRNAYRRCLGTNSERQLSVQSELDVDWQRIPARNLARDDRVIADNGKTARSPFIEENIVQFLRSLEPFQKCCFSFPEGVGDKLLLRLYGYKIGLRDVALLKKRAIQFGSRIANKRENASAQSEHLKCNT